jgi:hypothetical protein
MVCTTLLTSRAARSRVGRSASSANTGPWHEDLDHFATHASGNPPKRPQDNTILGFGLFELLYGLPRSLHLLADLTLAESERSAH